MSNHPSRRNRSPNPSATPSPRPAGPTVPPDGTPNRVTVEQIVRQSERLNKIEAYTDVDLVPDDALNRALATDRVLAAALTYAGRLDLLRLLTYDLAGSSRPHRIRALSRLLAEGIPPRLLATIITAVALIEADREWCAAAELAADQRFTLGDAMESVANLEVDVQIQRRLIEADLLR